MKVTSLGCLLSLLAAATAGAAGATAPCGAAAPGAGLDRGRAAAQWLGGAHRRATASRRSGPAAAVPAPAGAQVVDLPDATLLPGLMDIHSHLFLHPYNETPWNDQVLKEPVPYRTLRAGVQARATLLAGFTTLRDLGTEGADYADVVAAGVPSPTGWSTGRACSSPRAPSSPPAATGRRRAGCAPTCAARRRAPRRRAAWPR